jgi:hypothetical protein
MTMPDSPPPAPSLMSSRVSSFASRAQLPLGLRARDGRLLGESLPAHGPSTTRAVEPERTAVDHAQLSLFAPSFAPSLTTRRPR